MDDTISRQAAIDALDECYCGGEDSCGEPWVYKENAVEAIQMIEPIPSAEPKRGWWIEIINSRGVVVALRCSRCEKSPRHGVRSDFCPNCGSYNGGEYEV